MATLNPKLKDFWLDDKGKLRKARNRVLHGGRTSSKSWELACRASQLGQKYRTRFLCVRRFQNKIKESVYTLIKNQIDNFGFQGYDVQASTIKHSNGSEFVFYGIERNIEEIKSFEGADVLWVEEAQNLTRDQWDILEPTIRKKGSEIWLSFNGRLVTDFVWQYFIVNTPKNTIVRHINYTDNPFLSETMMEVIDELKASDYDRYEHVYLGKPLSDSEKTIIKRKWLDAAVDFHLEYDGDMTGQKIVGYDLADSGDDLNSKTLMDGSVCLYCDEWKGGEDELTKSAKNVRMMAKKNDALIIYDCIGVGAGTGSTLNDLDYRNHAKFNAAGKVIKPIRKYEGIKQKDFFSNLKAQAWWLVADRLRKTYDYKVNGNHKHQSSDLISISSKINNIEGLLTELSTPFKDFDKSGRVKVESKADLKDMGVKSPNKADSFIMAASRSLVSQSKVNELDITGF